ncbi:capsid assembly scaffolding protein Gp46 family protein [Oscillibacter sp.]|uniref:capsid assembly scaffolding protein Gp46 family protein n=1 Tax=Oscillibacter sp. TaxID=1945593 RepID=UPI001B606C24|nr:DUF4355 domain-containing protein [Oscillibacter sp.]MBP3509415.1 DUF4355 domain-containing protein [Oscillibacter sp.]
MTEDEKKELEVLRREKQQRLQRDRARAALETAGVSVSFASLLAGSDDSDTDQRTQDFCAAYQEALAEDVRKRLPQQPPVVTPPAPKRARRGIQRIR